MATSVTIPDDKTDDAAKAAEEYRGEKPEDKSQDKPGEKPEDKSQDKPGEKPEDKPTEKPEGDKASLEIEGDGEGDDKDPKLGDALDFEGLLTEWEENSGELSDESREQVSKVLEEAGFPADVLDTYILGLNALKEVRTTKVHTAAGGADEYKSMLGWAKENLSKEEIEAFNSAVSGSDAQAELAVAGLVSKWKAGGEKKQEAEDSDEPDLRNRGNRRTGGGAGGRIASRAQLAGLINDPKYRTDPAFRAQVQRDLKAAMESGEYLTTDN